MRLIRDLHSCPPDYKNAAVALGNFDGVHLGHQAILRETVALARANRCSSAVMTFEPHPREFFGRIQASSSFALREGYHAARDSWGKPKDDGVGRVDDGGGSSLRLYTLRQKLEILKDSGIDLVFLMRFNKNFAATSAQSFIDDILHKKLGVRHVVTGQNFFFGQNRQGNRELLAREAHRLEFGFTAHPPVYDASGELISSSAIREKLVQGEMASASAMLGRPYAIEGRVMRGKQRNIGFPTANINLAKRFKPRRGIYAIRARIEGDARVYDGAASLGINPTFGGHEPLLEAHLFAMNRELYGKRISVELVHHMRGEQAFTRVEDLQRQIEDDCRVAKHILGYKE